MNVKMKNLVTEIKNPKSILQVLKTSLDKMNQELVDLFREMQEGNKKPSFYDGEKLESEINKTLELMV